LSEGIRVPAWQVGGRPAVSQQCVTGEQMSTNSNAETARRMSGCRYEPDRPGGPSQFPAISLADPICRAARHSFTILVERHIGFGIADCLRAWLRTDQPAAEPLSQRLHAGDVVEMFVRKDDVWNLSHLQAVQ